MLTWHLDQLTTQTSLPEEGLGLWVPAELLSHHQIPLPVAPRRKWAAMLPWLMEDRILEPVERMHFVITARHADHLDVIAMRRSDMDACLETAAKVEVQVLAAQPDYLALPWYTGEIVVAWRLSGASRVLLVRTSENEGFAAPEGLAEVLLGRVLKDSEAELVALMPEQALPAFLRSHSVKCEEAPDWHIPMRDGINLLSGDYAVKNTAQIDKRGIQAAAALLFLALILAFVWLRTDVSKMENAVTLLEETQQRQFSQLFPGISGGDDLRSTLETLQDTGFQQREKMQEPVAALLLALDSALASCTCELTSIELAAGNGRLEFKSGAPAGLETLPGYSVTSGLNEDGGTQTTISLASDGRTNVTRVAQ
jgi:type II secretion system protein L